MQRRDPRFGRGEHQISEEPSVNVDQVKLELLRLFRSPDYKPPVLPAVAVELLALTQKRSVNVAEVSRLLSKDPMLAGQVLKIAQSAAYSRGEPVRSLDDAIVRLGLSRISDLFLRAALEMKVFRAAGYDHEMEALRLHSAFTAEAVRIVCRHSIGLDDYAFLCGLLHDVGIAACILALTELAKKNKTKLDFEHVWPGLREIHAACSEMLAKIWQLPADIALVLSLHHTMVFEGRVHPLAAAVAVADGLADEVGFGFHGEMTAVQTESAAQMLGLDAGTLDRIRSATVDLAKSFKS
ncbi:MAG TPA: HDOD domain-containing protein [Polyangiaceae bacterium]|nr:HDOD domain-containing protein [Polyangiaceae bacterium]